MTLRVTRGLFRLWLVLTVLWIGCVGTTAWVVWPPAPDVVQPVIQAEEPICIPGEKGERPLCFTTTPPPPKEPNPYDQFHGFRESLQVTAGPDRKHAVVVTAIVFALAPPLFLLTFGSALTWAVRGFRG
jgi:hypothetical protein